MRMKHFVTLWLFIFVFLGFEFWALNYHPESSILSKFAGKIPYIPEGLISPEPGRPLSLWYGWTGLSLILLTNLYILKKRWGWLRGMGSPLSNWMDFHIFCGLMGPTFILFHSNFKVRGLVAISFWSMLVSVTSGVIGRYLYLQLVSQKSDLDQRAQQFLDRIIKYKEKVPQVTDEDIELAKERALRYVGVYSGDTSQISFVGAVGVFFLSFFGDLRRLVGTAPGIQGFPRSSGYLLEGYAVATRRSLFLDVFQRLMGYWHTFHAPFAYFMYGAAIIHVATALLLGVKK